MTPTQTNSDGQLRDHVYDGIQEFDKRLPNWWLITLHGAIIFAFAYWFFYHWPANNGVVSEGVQVEREMSRIRAEAAASGKGELTDDAIWAMSKDPQIVANGKAIFKANCVSCHGVDLKGGIGANLVDQVWIHGGKPTQVVNTITTGVAAKGMPTWGPILGRKRVLEAAAFVLSHHQP